MQRAWLGMLAAGGMCGTGRRVVISVVIFRELSWIAVLYCGRRRSVREIANAPGRRGERAADCSRVQVSP